MLGLFLVQAAIVAVSFISGFALGMFHMAGHLNNVLPPKSE
jgi:hypothetical protein